ncbi:MAG: prepilin-type N-terminal cleavage/methylation domain-containing protein [Candidatus Omnitrophica bacterium]|nr:prepilin-type N-terminal cleavage/methylation domain-containing protein [Candidatus Omnitrophota bacterium]
MCYLKKEQKASSKDHGGVLIGYNSLFYSLRSSKVRIKSFTLIELVIVVALAAVVSLAIYRTFASGLNIWKKTRVTPPQEETAFFFEKFTAEARNSLKFTGINFSGEKDRVEFPTLVESRILGKTVGKIAYIYDEGRHILRKKQYDYSQSYLGGEGSSYDALTNVSSFHFTYYFFDEHKNEYVWMDECVQNKIPIAIHMEFELSSPEGLTFNFSKTIRIPVESY